jgi:hypothetical protein
MYGNLLPKTGFALASIGVALTAYDVAWLVIGFFVISGALITLLKLFPRVAIEPISETGPTSPVRWRWRITVNGIPIGGRHRR